MITGTVRSVWRVARKKLKENPGVRFHIGAYYRHLLNNEPILVSKENVVHATQVLSRIDEELLKNVPGLDRTVAAAEAPVGEIEAKTTTRKVLLTGASGLLG